MDDELLSHVLHDIEKQIIKALQSDPDLTEDEISQETKLSMDQIRRGVEWLRQKKLADVNAVDADGKAVMDVRTGKQMVTVGLKTVWISQTKETANYLLRKSDWEVTRKAEKGTAIASETSTFRDKVRTACDTIETKINNCSNLTEFKALFDVPVDSDGKATGNAPIYDFPDEA